MTVSHGESFSVINKIRSEKQMIPKHDFPQESMEEHQFVYSDPLMSIYHNGLNQSNEVLYKNPAQNS